MFHSKDGLGFERLEDGSVRIIKADNVFNPKKIDFEVILDSDAWVSVISFVCANAGTAEKHQEALSFHNLKKEVAQ